MVGNDLTGAGVIAIPARFASTRLPNKLLLAKTGKPLLAHVIDRCLEAVEYSGGMLTEVIVATDDERLEAAARSCGVYAVMTGRDHRCGTTRIAEAIEKSKLKTSVKLVVNVQGDEPELSPRAIVHVAERLITDPSSSMATLVIAMPAGTETAKSNPNAVKAVIDRNGRAIYFSRAAVPYDRNAVASGEALWHHHVGVYAYRLQFLYDFARMAPSPLEEREGLEQLRVIEAGYSIATAVIPEAWAAKGIDTPEDYDAFVKRWAILRERNAA